MFKKWLLELNISELFIILTGFPTVFEFM